MRVGVSSCLLGNKCRYNGLDSRDNYILNVLSNYFELVPFCPEEIVFSTPREPIRLVEVDNKIAVHTVKSQKDVTKELQDSCDNLVSRAKNSDLCGFILKSKSPSCGLERVKVYEPNSYMCEKKGVGLFANSLLEKFKFLPIEEEGRLNDAWLKENFIMQVFAYGDLMEFISSNPTPKELVDFHTKYKYLIYSKSEKLYKILGNIVANHQKNSIDLVLKDYRESFLEAISKKGSLKKSYNILLHIFGYFKKKISKAEKVEILDMLEEFKSGIIPLIAVIKVINIYVVKFDIKYLKLQKFLNPYPKKLALRSTVKAYK